MNQLNNFYIPYSLKNIPFVTKYTYQMLLTRRIEEFLERVRWKMFFFKSNIPKKEVERYGFKTRRQAPPDKDLKAFEDDLIGLVQKVETRYFSNPLQE